AGLTEQLQRLPVGPMLALQGARGPLQRAVHVACHAFQQDTGVVLRGPTPPGKAGGGLARRRRHRLEQCLPELPAQLVLVPLVLRPVAFATVGEESTLSDGRATDMLETVVLLPMVRRGLGYVPRLLPGCP